jgi:ribonucleoside-diphosphate reductase alpha chain
MGILVTPEDGRPGVRPLPGERCPECGNATLIHKDGCLFCTACGHIGACG